MFEKGPGAGLRCQELWFWGIVAGEPYFERLFWPRRGAKGADDDESGAGGWLGRVVNLFWKRSREGKWREEANDRGILPCGQSSRRPLVERRLWRVVGNECGG